MPLLLEREGDVVDDLQMRIQRVRLKDHADIAVLGLKLGYILIAEKILPEVGSSRPAMQLSVVVLPQPEGPSSATKVESSKDEIDAVQRDGLRVVFLAEIFQCESYASYLQRNRLSSAIFEK